MKSLPLNMLRAFAMVYDTGGVRPAARQLEVTHSSVSRFVSELEAALGVALIHRGKGRRSIDFTPDGERVGKAALKSLTELDRTIEAVRRKESSTTVTIETTPSFAARWLLPRLGEFEKELAWVELSVTVDQRVTSPEECTADLVVRMGGGPWTGFECSPLMDDALIPVASVHYLEGLRPKFDLCSARLLHDRDPSASWSEWKRRFGPNKLKADLGPRYTSGDLVLRAAEQGLGVALARRSFADDALQSGALRRVFEHQGIALPASIWVIRPQHRRLTKAVAATVDWLKRNAGRQRASATI